jgi:hypothetical protein
VPREPGVVTAGFFKGIGEDGEAGHVEGAGGQLTFVVGGFGETTHDAVVPREPAWRNRGRGAKGVKDVP